MEHQNPRVIGLGHQTIMPYLILNGARQFISFVKKVFGMELQVLVPRSEEKVKHAELRSGGCTLMVADTTDDYPTNAAGIFIYVDNADEVYHQALDNGAISVLEPVEQNYGYTAGVRDLWGNTWWITQMPGINRS